ncbi:MAG: AMP-binding protein [Candidatus Ratteibacteria bacterium]
MDKKEKVAEIIYTSGTTGKVKGVILTHDNLISNINSICKFLPITQNDIFVSVLPFFHAFGSTCGMFLPLKLGATIILFSKFVPDVILKNIEKFSATIFMGIPSMFKVFNDLSKKEIFDLSSLRLCISGAAPLNLNIMDDFEKNFGIPIYEGYGLTECSPVVSVNPFGKRKKGSVGLPLPGVSMKIVDENGEELKEGEIGEIIVKGENVMKGYLNQPEETEKNIFKRMA